MRQSWRAVCAQFVLVFAFCTPAAAQAPAGRENPQEIFERAMGERERGELYEAIRSFNAILDQHPGLNRARLELAVAYYQALDHRAALEQARRVLADPATPPAVRANVERLIAQIEADAAPHRFNAYAAGGFLYDSNVSAGPGSPSYELGGTLIPLDPNAVKRSDSGLLLTAGGSHRYLSGFRPGLGAREGALLWQSQLLVSVLDYRDESAFDLQVLSITTGPAWISPPRLRFLAPLQFDRLEQGDEHYVDILGVSPTLVIGNPAGLELTVESSLQNRNYQRAIDAGRDSDYYNLGLLAGRVISGMTLQGGVRFSRDDADDPQWDYQGVELVGYIAGEVYERIGAYARLSYGRNEYDNPDPVAGIGRTDRETRLGLGASYRFGAAPSEPWSLNATLLVVRHRSEVAFYAFDRNQFSVTLTRSFF
jgi:hypothetical protein